MSQVKPAEKPTKQELHYHPVIGYPESKFECHVKTNHQGFSFSPLKDKVNSAVSTNDRSNSHDLFFPVQNLHINDLYDMKVLNNRSSYNQVQRPKTGTVVTCNGERLALFRYGLEIFALDEKCPHLGGPLHLGDIESFGEACQLCVVCPWHKWKIDLHTGQVKVPSGRHIRTGTYPTKVLEDGSIHIGFERFSSKFVSSAIDF